METEIQKFYKNKNVFLTGGTGFLGKVFIEKILRVTDVERIYLLIRPKRGKTVTERIDDIFRDPLFEKLNKLKPNSTKRITPIFGDCVLPNLGLSTEDCTTLIDNVDIVVHSAATVRFNEPLSNAVAINVRATMDLIRLAKQMFKLQAFVHVSSAFANCTVRHVDEKYYVEKLGTTAEKVCIMADLLGADILNSMTKELCKDFPNTYCFTKALAEEAVLTQGRDLPICIFRPGIVIPTYHEPVPGWIDNLYGPISILYGAALGVLRVLYARVDTNANIVPVDFCANMMLTCAWNTAKSVNQVAENPPPIYNLVPDDNNGLKWADYIRAIEDYGGQMPLPNMIWLPFLIATDSKLFYKLLCFFYHTLPGYFFDSLLFLAGKKRRMVRTYQKIHRQTALLDYFVENDWTFSMDNTKLLWKSLTTEDQNLFKFDTLSIDWPKYFYNSLLGMRRYLSKEEPESIPKGLRLWRRLLILHRTVQVLVYGGGLAMLSWTSHKVWLWL